MGDSHNQCQPVCDSEPRCDCGSLFEICNHPNCPCGGDEPEEHDMPVVKTTAPNFDQLIGELEAWHGEDPAAARLMKRAAYALHRLQIALTPDKGAAPQRLDNSECSTPPGVMMPAKHFKPALRAARSDAGTHNKSLQALKDASAYLTRLHNGEKFWVIDNLDAAIAAHSNCDAVNATEGPWSVSDVRTFDGEYMVVGGPGQEFGLIACCPMKADAELIVRLRERCAAYKGQVEAGSAEIARLSAAPADGARGDNSNGDPADVWDDYCDEVPEENRSLQGALAFGYWANVPPARCGVQCASDALRALADLFSESVHETWTKDEIVSVIEDAIAMGSPSPDTARGREAREKEITRLATIAECAALCDSLRRKDYSGENADWVAGTLDCATAIRSLALPSAHSPSEVGK